MTQLILVRHGEPRASWADGAADPGLTEVGRAQAEAVAAELGPLGPRPVVVSPLLRARETAAPLERRWGVTARVDPRVGEVPAPGDGEDRMAWLSGLLARPWQEWPAPVLAWRAGLFDALRELGEQGRDAVVVTHYVAITVACGTADRNPGLCSRTPIELIDGRPAWA